MGCKQTKLRRDEGPQVEDRQLGDIKELPGAVTIIANMLQTEIINTRKKFSLAVEGAIAEPLPANYSSTVEHTALPFCTAICTHLRLNYKQTMEVFGRVIAKITSGSKLELNAEKKVVEAAAEAVTHGEAQAFPQDSHSKMLVTWLHVDKDLSGTLTLPEITKLLNILNVALTQKEVQHKMDKVDHNRDGQLNYEEFLDFFSSLTDWSELKPIFTHFLAPGAPDMTLAQLKDFYKTFQGGQIVDDEEIKTVLGRQDLSYITLTDFGRLISNPNINAAMDPRASGRIYHNMTHPLWHYYMSSSHNTYLSGDQLASESKETMYSSALLDGCRCVELDCWDGPDGQPIVYHGYTRTTKIKFEGVIKAIRDSAFQTSLYPVTLSLEVHTSPAQQTEMARIMNKYLGDNIMTTKKFVQMIQKEVPGLTAEQCMTGKYITPYRLKKCIIIKGKRLKQDPKEAEADEEEDVEKCEEIKSKKKEVVHKLSQELSDIVFMPSSHLKGGLEEGAAKAEVMSVCSFVETKSDKFSAPGSINAYAHHNKKRFARIYPAGSRITSTNYDPVPHWVAGAQIVALNWQTRDSAEMRINLGNFRDNGGCGFLLKPACLREDGRNHDDYQDSATLTLSLLSAYMLPKEGGAHKKKGEVIDPYVIVKLRGAAKDNVTLFQSSVINDNGYHPVWGSAESPITGTHAVQCKELCLVVVEVWDKDMGSSDDLVAEGVIPLRTMRQGIRAVTLTDKYGVKASSSVVLMNVKIENFKS